MTNPCACQHLTELFTDGVYFVSVLSVFVGEEYSGVGLAPRIAGGPRLAPGRDYCDDGIGVSNKSSFN